MTPEERFERIERNIEFLVDQQAKHDSMLGRLEANMIRLEGIVTQLADVLGRTVTVVDEFVRQTGEFMRQTDERFRQLIDSQQRTDERLNIVINLVERYFSDGRKNS